MAHIGLCNHGLYSYGLHSDGLNRLMASVDMVHVLTVYTAIHCGVMAHTAVLCMVMAHECYRLQNYDMWFWSV